MTSADVGGRDGPVAKGRAVARPGPSTAPAPTRANQLFADYIERREAGETVDLNALCAANPEFAIQLCVHEQNRGKGAAVRSALELATGDLVIIQDGDLEYDPRDYPVLLEPILDGLADAVFGSRFLGGPHRVLYFWHSVGNRFLTTLSNIMTNFNLTDMEVCYKAMRREVALSLNLRSERFGIEPEITAKLARGGWRLYEVPVTYAGRSYGEGKKITWRDGIAALWHILYFRFRD